MGFYCSRCGTGLPVGARFCSSCGTVVAAPPAQTGPLVRPLLGRQIAGVCIGLARTYGWDVSLVRVLAVLGLLFSGGVVGVAYVAAWIGIPEEQPGSPAAYPPKI